MWRDIFGDELKVAVQPIEQGAYFGLALAGLYQMVGMRAHGGVDPIEQWLWWTSATAHPIDPTVPELSMNMGRFMDPDIDAAIDVIRHNPDPEARRKRRRRSTAPSARTCGISGRTGRCGASLPIRTCRTSPTCPIPGNDAGAFPVNSGAHHVAQIWCTRRELPPMSGTAKPGRACGTTTAGRRRHDPAVAWTVAVSFALIATACSNDPDESAGGWRLR